MISRRSLVLIGIVGAAAFVVAAKPTIAVPGLALDRDGILALATESNVQDFGGRLDPKMVTAIAFVESHFNPSAIRLEANSCIASIGLMQVCLSTAQWLYDAQGYRFRDRRPTFANLFEVELNMFNGMAYLDYLTDRNGLTKGGDEQLIVRAYNGGPGNARNTSTNGYWAKYQAAKQELFG